ncbi:hypothetical protein NHX12_033370 [Muraenolepis orangiensis]|uniref:Uncharacterized protein n=1 Tax=Muraenolepis orangiensis TaxID=630683 RepID=A0A9Q0E298_9TELE|nr:hypothetical protein NHX12_033370 [Muraenolepis orangiensis]
MKTFGDTRIDLQLDEQRQSETTMHNEKDTDTTTKRDIALKCLILNMGESVEDLIKEFLVSGKEEAGELLQQETIAISVIRDAQAAPKDIGIILEGQEVVNKLASVANAVAILLGFLYALNLEYPNISIYTESRHRAGPERQAHQERNNQGQYDIFTPAITANYLIYGELKCDTVEPDTDIVYLENTFTQDTNDKLHRQSVTRYSAYIMKEVKLLQGIRVYLRFNTGRPICGRTLFHVYQL